MEFAVCASAAFLQEFEPISTQDARVQGLSLNPSKISGNCGRLLCCLKYEAEFYNEVRSKYPEIGEVYSDNGIKGIVDRISVLEDYMVIRNEEGLESRIEGEDILKRQKEKIEDTSVDISDYMEPGEDETPDKPEQE